MNLDLLYQATALTFDPKYAKAATSQADITARTFIRDDCTTYHVVDFDPHSTVDESTGHATVLKRFTHQGYADESCWDAGSGLGDIWLCTVWSVALLMLTTIQGMCRRLHV